MSRIVPISNLVDVPPCDLCHLKQRNYRYYILETENNSKVIIDYAHTPDSLLKVLKYANSFSGKVILAFGCGGDRDFSKRKMMGEIAEKYSDKVIISKVTGISNYSIQEKQIELSNKNLFILDYEKIFLKQSNF